MNCKRKKVINKDGGIVLFVKKDLPLKFNFNLLNFIFIVFF